LIDHKKRKHDTVLHLSVDALFDVQVKRIHEYKRQLLNVLHVIYLYNRIKKGDIKKLGCKMRIDWRQGGSRLSHGKKTIKLINNVAQAINSDPAIGDKLALIFLPDYRCVSHGKNLSGR